MDFRPISCCNVVYKVIAKILANRISPILEDIVNVSQSAFVKQRYMVENIYLVQELGLNDGKSFNFHPGCGELKITHLAFADDLILFSRGDYGSVKKLVDGLNSFSKCSGLKANPLKSTLYLAGLSSFDLENIKDLTGFQEGFFPFKYLEIPLASTRLNVTHYALLVSRIGNTIDSWPIKTLSYAGKLELINSVVQGWSYYSFDSVVLIRFCWISFEAISLLQLSGFGQSQLGWLQFQFCWQFWLKCCSLLE
ncbi:uncharacterized protein LOC131148225 [Malania oleifera]|uniref:uncharacterized protein LOC131148225 n=1 Tax=Malania oleifera TaxID=397392 RepID=UPI0025AE44E0|nr:uncharacterized protein LOC131148225 [Malania oleifera]